jgi:hypothetical protein
MNKGFTESEENMKYKYIIEIELDEENEIAKNEFDCAMGEGACLRNFLEELSDEINDMCPYGIRVTIKA